MPDEKKLGLQSIEDIFKHSDKKIVCIIEDINEHINKVLSEIETTIEVYELNENDYLQILKKSYEDAIYHSIDMSNNSNCDISIIVKNILLLRSKNIGEKYKV